MIGDRDVRTPAEPRSFREAAGNDARGSSELRPPQDFERRRLKSKASLLSIWNGADREFVRIVSTENPRRIRHHGARNTIQM